jgi:hypothetical protein
MHLIAYNNKVPSVHALDRLSLLGKGQQYDDWCVDFGGNDPDLWKLYCLISVFFGGFG